jgi:hypothetical protein
VPPESPTIIVTVHIDLNGQPLPPAAEGLFESLRALAGSGIAVVADNSDRWPAEPEPPPVAPAPRCGGRPRLVRRGGDPSLRVYLASRMVLSDGAPVRLTRREYDLLVFLCQNPRRVFSRGQLLQHVWGYQMVSGERTVDVHVRRLRVKLGDRDPLIATVRGVGYRLDDAARVTVLPDTN